MEPLSTSEGSQHSASDISTLTSASSSSSSSVASSFSAAPAPAPAPAEGGGGGAGDCASVSGPSTTTTTATATTTHGRGGAGSRGAKRRKSDAPAPSLDLDDEGTRSTHIRQAQADVGSYLAPAYQGFDPQRTWPDQSRNHLHMYGLAVKLQVHEEGGEARGYKEGWHFVCMSSERCSVNAREGRGAVEMVEHLSVDGKGKVSIKTHKVTDHLHQVHGVDTKVKAALVYEIRTALQLCTLVAIAKKANQGTRAHAVVQLLLPKFLLQTTND